MGKFKQSSTEMHEKLISNLGNLASQADWLAKNLHQNGEREMSACEKAVCRIAMAQDVEDLFMEAKSKFMAGIHPDLVFESIKQAEDIIEMFSDK